MTNESLLPDQPVVDPAEAGVIDISEGSEVATNRRVMMPSGPRVRERREPPENDADASQVEAVPLEDMALTEDSSAPLSSENMSGNEPRQESRSSSSRRRRQRQRARANAMTDSSAGASLGAEAENANPSQAVPPSQNATETLTGSDRPASQRSESDDDESSSDPNAPPYEEDRRGYERDDNYGYRREFRDRYNGRDDRGQRNNNNRQQGGRDRGPYGQREGRNGSQRDREWHRDIGGYRDTAPRNSTGRERSTDQEGAPRPADLLIRGFIVSYEQNGGVQWHLRTQGYLPSSNDAIVPNHIVRSYSLRVGDEVVGMVRSPLPGRRYGELLDVQSINGVPLERLGRRPYFDELTPIYPEHQIRLERPDSVTARLIDLIAPIGFGQRALIVSPPKAGKTIILKEIGRSINLNYPEVKVIVCLVGERPEEVTDLSKSIQGEIISSTFDEAVSHHTELAELTVERAKRLVESGFDVVVLLDSITRLARAYNLAAPGDSRSLSGGMATSALYPPKRFFGAARALQQGGSLTVIATCLIDTNSRLDDVIYEELKGTGNMELVLDRRMAEERIFPAIDLVKSSTRREELLLPANELTAVQRLRRVIAMSPDQTASTQRIIQQMERTQSNAEFLTNLFAQISAARS
ncbi:MAG: transcription termination factor Rho [Chloroflexi bacterium]|nr:transcription termination factor Rho [Chloroflexota bacterium]